MVDSNNREQIIGARDELKQLLNEPDLRNVLVLVYANKMVSRYGYLYQYMQTKSRNYATTCCKLIKQVLLLMNVIDSSRK